jgi:chitinase
MNCLRLLAFIVIAVTLGCNRKNADPPQNGNHSGMHVAAYLYSENFWNDNFSTDLSRITDLNLAFINPDTNAAFNINTDVALLVNRAHAANVKVYISLGGAAAPAHTSDVLKDGKRQTLVHNLTAIAEQFNFDGVDVDLEGDFIDENYADLINELSASLRSKNKIITAALATWNGDIVHDSTLTKFDFINVMSYDKTGPWDPSNPGQHSPYEMALADANYYTITRGIDPKKILIGLPFYGHGFGPGAPESLEYSNIVALYPGAEDKDMVQTPGGGKIYYNGRQTIARKVALARTLNVAGVMIWEINQDTRDEKSPLKVINDNK